jgi:hypothetical protein
MMRHVDNLPKNRRDEVKEQIIAVLRRYGTVETTKPDDEVWNEIPFTSEWHERLWSEMVRQLSQIERLTDTTETSNLKHLAIERHARKIRGVQRLRRMVKSGWLGPDVNEEVKGVNKMLRKATSWQTL